MNKDEFMLKMLACITALTLLSGCANNMVKEIPASPVTQEPDTPFVFQPYYQSKPVGIDQQKVVHHSDFATIVSEIEYVFAPRKSMFAPRASVHGNQATPSIEEPQPDTSEPLPRITEPSADSSLSQALERASNTALEAPSNTPSVSTSERQCQPIICDGGVECGKVMVCGGEPCDASKRVYYDCTGDNCGLTKTTTDIMDSAKYTSLCTEFSDLYSCPNQTLCK
jgi:hypothetical protein